MTVVIVAWNSSDVLPVCLESLAGSEPMPAEVIIVDNASSDGGVGLVRAWGRKHTSVATKVLENAANRGFASAANQGIDAGTQRFVCLVNPDVRLMPDTLALLVDALERAADDVAVVGPKLMRGVGSDLKPSLAIDSTGIIMTRDGRHLDRGAESTDQGQFDTEEDVFGITGAFALFRRDALEASRVDGEVFDEDFFAYREDADLAWRLQGFGYRARYVPGAVAYHRRTATPERRRSLPAIVNYHSVKNRFLLRVHHADQSWLLHFGVQSLLRDIVVIGACLAVERSSLPAFRWLVGNLGTHRRRRREILARRTRSSAALRDWFKPRPKP